MKGNFIYIFNVDLFTTYKSIIYKRIQILSSPSFFSFSYYLITILLFSIQVNIFAQSNKPEVIQITGRLLDQNKKPLSNFSISLLECFVNGRRFCCTENYHDTLYNISGLLRSDQESWDIETFNDPLGPMYKSPCDGYLHVINMGFEYIRTKNFSNVGVIVKQVPEHDSCAVSKIISFFNHLSILVLGNDNKPINTNTIKQYVPLYRSREDLSVIGISMPIKLNDSIYTVVAQHIWGFSIGLKCTTTETGEFVFRKKNLSPGTYTILLDDAGRRPEFLLFIMHYGIGYPSVLTSDGWPLTFTVFPNQINKNIGDIIVNTDLEKMK